LTKKVRKLPLRMCVGCQEKKNKRDLVRVVRSPEGDISLDFTGKKPGRGAYICPQRECLEAAIKKKRLEKSLQQSLSETVMQQLRESLKADE
jgi:uncharacterized protein